MRIYLVDDETIVNKTLQDFLSELGHEVVSVKSADELLDSLEKAFKPVDLIIADLHMAKENAVTLIREAHKRYPDIDIVLMTAGGPLLPTEKAISYGVYAYLRKPIRLAELEFLLARYFKSRTNDK
jgi:NtrC-family two-component system response regulator AlgB